MLEFIWNDGGRAAAGFVGLAGDCVTRAIAIATGTSYRDIYRELGEASKKSPRGGVVTTVAETYLKQREWQYYRGSLSELASAVLPKGVVIVQLADPTQYRSGHFCTVIDHVVHDTWNASEDDELCVVGFWTPPVVIGEPTPGNRSTLPSAGCAQPVSAEQTLTQKEFDKVLQRLRALDNTANNSASTEGEKRNALRMMQNLMLRHNMTRDDITEGDNVESMCFTRIACPVNGRRACAWEKSLAAYLVQQIFPLTSWYVAAKGNRTLFWFYGPVDEVRNCIGLFREMLLTIAASAQLQYGGYSRGSGASYAEGYVHGLPRENSGSPQAAQAEQTALIQNRALVVQQAARNWLRLECGLQLATQRGRGRDKHDPAAANRGKQHGAKHNMADAKGQKRITSR